VQQGNWTPEGVLLLESAAFSEAPLLKEGQTADYPIKLIQPGRGSSGYYPAEVLKRDGPGVFKAGTQMFWNHPTDAEESQRPEGDLNHLAAITTSDAVFDENGKDGAGLYARAKVFSDYADKVKEKGKHIGLSIRAGGLRDDGAAAPDGRKGIITALKNAQSVDFVTRAGAGGKVFTEAGTGDKQMDKAEIQALIKESVDGAVAPLQAENQRLREHLALAQAPVKIREALQSIRLPEPAKKRILERIAATAPVKDGKLDENKLAEMIEAEAQSEAQFLSDLGFGSSIPGVGKRMTEAEIADMHKNGQKQHSENLNEALTVMADLFVGPKIPKGGMDEAARAARKEARKSFVEGRAA